MRLTLEAPSRENANMRVMLVSQMYPGPDDPQLGVFVRQLETELTNLGHDVERAVVEGSGGGRMRHLALARRALSQARSAPPDVVYGHFLFPACASAALAARRAGAPLVVTAHGRDVRNIGTIPGVARATEWVLGQAEAAIVVSEFLRRELQSKLPGTSTRIEVIDCGVDLDRFRPRDGQAARDALEWRGEGPFFVHVGTLDERKNVLRLAEAFSSLETGQLAFVGDGPLRSRLEGRDRIRVVGKVSPDEVSAWIAAADAVCQPSLVEPFGLAILEAMASGRTVVATRIGGPSEFVVPEAGMLVDPLSVGEIGRAMRAAPSLGSPNLRAREAASAHDVKLQARRIAEVLECARARAQR